MAGGAVIRTLAHRGGRSAVASVLVILLALVVGWAATRSSGRQGTESTTNDGGAWLLNRDSGAIGHLNREVLEVSAAIRVADPGADFDVSQGPGMVVAHDRSSGRVLLIDQRTHQSIGEFLVPEQVEVAATSTGLLVHQIDPLQVWVFERQDLLELATLGDITPTLSSSSPGLVSVATDASNATNLAHDSHSETIIEIETGETISVPLMNPLTGLSSAGSLALATDGSTLAIASFESSQLIDVPDLLVLQQPSEDAASAVGITAAAEVIWVDLGSGKMQTIAVLTGRDPLPPINHGGCVFTVVTTPPTFGKYCIDGTVETAPLVGTGGELDLRLVNGWVWINDVETGGTWLADADTSLAQIDDWGFALGDRQRDEAAAAVDEGGGVEEVRVAPDSETAELVEADEHDGTADNQAPIARDDFVETRVDRPTVVAVLANDEDPNGDVLLVDHVELVGQGNGRASITTARNGVQVSPAAGFTGELKFNYTITDGRGGEATALGTVIVSLPSQADNEPPQPVTDVATVRAGATVSLNVLENDRDPNGDSLILREIGGDGGTITSDPGGQITFSASPTGEEARLELTYTVADDLGATSEGRVLIDVRLEDANSSPDARNDAIVTSAGNPATGNVLLNDSDPDNDALIVARQATLIRSPRGALSEDFEAVDEGTQPGMLTADGEFFFVPDSPGAYVFEYLVSDGQNTDTAQIRIEATDADTNRPPTAVRDDATIPIGASRLIHVLENDGDPDGDVVGIVEWVGAPGLAIEEVPGVGFRVTASADAAAVIVFRYAISDGQSDPVEAVVVVSVVDVESVNHPPIATADAIELRPGRSSDLVVLSNDYDPEGEALTIVRVAEVPGVDASFEIGPLGQDLTVSLGAQTTSSFRFSYDVADPQGATSAAVVDVRVMQPNEPNRPPVARSDIGRTTQGVAVDLPVLGNDSDPDGDRIQIESIASQPTNGTTELTDNGMLRYEPTDDFAGTDRFTYVLIDTTGERTIGQVQVGVTPRSPENRPPSANDDATIVGSGGTPVVIDVLANDHDPEGDNLVVVSTTSPSAGDVRVDEAGNVILTPPDLSLLQATDAAEPFVVTFVYSVSDGHGNTDDALVTVTVEDAASDLPPVAVDDTLGPIRGNTTVVVDVAANDEDPDGDRAELVVSTAEPDVRVRQNQLVVSVGTESSQHRYLLTDADGLAASAVLTIFVVDNEAPVVSGLTVDTPRNTEISMALGPQATDADGDPLFFSCCDNVVGGTTEVTASSENTLNVRFVPAPDFVGRGGFAYAADDQAGHVVSGWVVVNVLPPENQAPLAQDAKVELGAGSRTSVDLAGLVSDPDPDDALTFTLESLPDDLTMALAGSTLTIDAPINAVGVSRSVTYGVTDGAGNSTTGTITASVEPVDALPPRAVADQASTTQGQPVEIQLLANDVDPLGEGLTITQTSSSEDGETGEGSSPGTVLFTPDSTFFGITVFNYTIADATESPDREALGQVTVSVVGRPEPPRSPAASASNGSAAVTWSNPVDNGGPIDAYRLEYSSSNGTTESIDLAAQNSHTWAGLTNGEEVQFRVRAHNPAGWGDWSDWSAPVRPDTRPDVAAAPSVSFADEALVVDWSTPSNQGSPITEYKLEIGGGLNLVTTVGAGTSHTWHGLTNGTEYQFRIAATNAAGDSDWSSWSASEHPLGPPLAPPTPSASRGNRFLDLGWGAPNNNGDSIVEYEVELRSSGQTVAIAGGATSSYRWANLENGVAQQFRVRASNRAAQPGVWSDWSAPITPCSVPGQSVAPTAIRGDQQVTLSWPEPEDEGCAILSYNLRSSAGTQSAQSTSHVFTGLTNGTSYSFEVQAVNEEGVGLWSNGSAPVTPAGPPSAPRIDSAAPSGAGSIALAWSGATGNGSPIAGYEVVVNGGPPTSVTGTSWTATGLADNSSYTFRVRACNAVACGSSSSQASAQTWGPPTQPLVVHASAGDNWWQLNWLGPASNGGSPVETFEIRANSSVNTSRDASAFAVYYNFPNGTPVAGQVRACNVVGCGPWASDTATPMAPPPAATISIGSAYNGAGCAGQCNYVHLSGSNFTPGNTVSISCFDSVDGQFLTTDSTVAGDGSVAADPCFYGFSGRTVWITVDGVTSNSLLWP